MMEIYTIVVLGLNQMQEKFMLINSNAEEKTDCSQDLNKLVYCI